ncbi:hypothetical protein ABIF64_007048 [Bradyrhizobium japonicum]|nr:hypothetical protein [Bradyrhizobium japonicum]MCP1787270.1 hypothetical protein [Bradyrhizobium japonicum]MCP1809147.1 hypothetical protein [Bradyrhizobium japonicum]MCP1818080.1 hypothetical protein [Bradyrhizobium japonicum]MCP1870411.1 hypothetical protein [Bradyrhizobium japonicum]
MENATTKILKVFCPTAQALFFFYENNPMHSRTLVDFKQEIVGWASRRRNHLFAFHVDGEVVGYAEQMRFAHLQG